MPMRTYVVAAGDRIFHTTIHGVPAKLSVAVDGVDHAVAFQPWLGRTHIRLVVDGLPHHVLVRPQGETVVVVVGADRYRVRLAAHSPVPRRGLDSAGPTTLDITAPMPGLIVSVEVAPGTRVEQGHLVAIMEAMKMQMEIHAPATGWVRTVHVRSGQDVATGTALVTLDRSGR